MWLIDTTTLELKSFSDTDQSYAILSHTWGADGEEVTFQEMSQGPLSTITKAKPGFQKIQKTCEIARTQLNLQYAWVDTCSIDKSSSAELSEAINSMFRWYQESEFCLTFLSDVDEDPESFEKSRWFTRGWTLQELVAPSRLIFFNKRWEEIGRKDTLSEKINQVTGIPIKILHGEQSLDDIPVAARMSWAAQRETKRKEDIAYCLMGIFDINMPMLYGEGENAFLRLQEEIIKQNADMSIFLWNIPSVNNPPAFSGLLAQSPAGFAGMGSVVEDTIGTLFVTSTPSYTLTNRGISIKTPIKVDESGRNYFNLGHRFPDGQRALIRFQRIGHDSAVRVHPIVRIHDKPWLWSDATLVFPKSLRNLQRSDLESNFLRITFSGEKLKLIQSNPKHVVSLADHNRIDLYTRPKSNIIFQLFFQREGCKAFQLHCYYYPGIWQCKILGLGNEDHGLWLDKAWDVRFSCSDVFESKKLFWISAVFETKIPNPGVPMAELTLTCTS